MKQLKTDVLIIGAGPAGSVAASVLREQGFDAIVVEKQVFPRFVIGESMLPVSMNILSQTGLLDAVQKMKFMRKNGAVFLRGNETCNFDFSAQSAGGWDYTYQAPRADYDKALADAVEARGVPFLYGHDVTAAVFSKQDAQVTVKAPDGSILQITSQFVIDASGYGRVLPRLLDLETPSDFPRRDSIFTHVTGDHRPAAKEEGKVWICMHPGGGWIWIIPFSNGKTSIGVVAEPGFFENFSGDPESQLRAMISGEPNAARRLSDMKFVFEPKWTRGFSCSVKQFVGERYVLVGNATEFLDPIFSSGVALALASAQRAAGIVARQLKGEQVDWQHEYVDYIRHGIDTFRAYVMAWYDGTVPNIFFAPNRDPQILRQVCSVLAGYVWDENNLYACHPRRALNALANLVQAIQS